MNDAVDSAPQTSGLPVALAQDLFTKVFVDLENSHFFRFDGLSTAIADGLCPSLPTSNCWNQESVGADAAFVVSPGGDAISENPNLQPKGDTDIRNKTNIFNDFLPADTVPDIDSVTVPDATITQHCTRGALIMAILFAMAMMF